MGESALLAATTGYNNVAIGFVAGYAITTGNSNVCVGESSLASCQTGYQNVAIGHLALSQYTGSACVAV